jgi:hypothetical protein
MSNLQLYHVHQFFVNYVLELYEYLKQFQNHHKDKHEHIDQEHESRLNKKRKQKIYKIYENKKIIILIINRAKDTYQICLIYYLKENNNSSLTLFLFQK